MAAEPRKRKAEDAPDWQPPPLKRSRGIGDTEDADGRDHFSTPTLRRLDAVAHQELLEKGGINVCTLLEKLGGAKEKGKEIGHTPVRAPVPMKNPDLPRLNVPRERSPKGSPSRRIELAIRNISHAIEMLGESREKYMKELQEIYIEMQNLSLRVRKSSEDDRERESVMKMIENCAEAHQFNLEKLPIDEVDTQPPSTPPTPPMSPS